MTKDISTTDIMVQAARDDIPYIMVGPLRPLSITENEDNSAREITARVNLDNPYLITVSTKRTRVDILALIKRAKRQSRELWAGVKGRNLLVEGNSGEVYGLYYGDVFII